MSESVPDAAAAADGAETPTPTSVGRRVRHPMGLALSVAAAIVVVDQITKRWALHRLGDGDEIHLVWTLQFNLAYNSGMAFSRGRGLGPLIGVVAVVVVGVLAVGAARVESLAARIASGMLIGGALGNLLDRLFREDGWLRGRVIDFIDPQWFPIFNVADMGITIGAILFLLATLQQARADERAIRAVASHDAASGDDATGADGGVS